MGAMRTASRWTMPVLAVALALIGGIVLPGVAQVGPRAREQRLRQNLHCLRRQVHRYHSDHFRPPGRSAEASEAGERLFVRDLTSSTGSHEDSSGVLQSSPALGPYLTRIPANPINGSDRVLVVSEAEELPDEPVAGYGWLFVPETLTVRANCTGRDSGGVAYFDY